MIKSVKSFISWRFYFLLSIIFLMTLGLVWRIFYLAILKQPFLREQGNERILRLVELPAERGVIFDRRNFPLAVSATAYAIWVNPLLFSPTSQELNRLADYLERPVTVLRTLVEHAKKNKRKFVYLQHGLAPDLAKQVQSLHLPGLYLQSTYKRYYPEGEVTGHLVGLTNVDDHGQEGIELGYDQWLRGETGKKWVMQDRLGRIIADVGIVRERKVGHDLVLSIDRRIQYLAFKMLLAGVTEHHAHAGSVVVLNVKTGEVLAMVNQPSFNPNMRPIQVNSRLRNRAVTDIFEPGSTIKAFSIASALETGRYQPNTIIDTNPGYIHVEHNIVRDEKNHGRLTVTQVMQVSSNVGVTKMIMELAPNQLWSLLHRVGFGDITGIGFPGEQSGLLIEHHPFGQFMRATLGFGYGLSVTALQLARAYSVLANGGVKMPISLLRLERPPSGEVVLDKKVAKQMLELLESVVTQGGTGALARVPGYRVAGKTGTAVKAGVGGYQQHHYTASFVGIAPVSKPSIVVAVVVHDPQGKNHSGGRVAGPIFAKIMAGTLQLLNIPSDA